VFFWCGHTIVFKSQVRWNTSFPSIPSAHTLTTGRGRFLFFSQELELYIGRTQYEKIKKANEKDILPLTDPRTKQVHRILREILMHSHCPELKQLFWEAIVIDSPVANAFVLPGGKVIVNTGILPVANTDHMLAAVLSHEIGHVLARHAVEKMSEQTFFGVFKLTFWWLFVPLNCGSAWGKPPPTTSSTFSPPTLPVLNAFRTSETPFRSSNPWPDRLIGSN
jgi:hypothetical protein